MRPVRPFPFDHAGDECAQAIEHPVETDPHDPVPIVQRELQCLTRPRSPGVVHQQVDLPKCFDLGCCQVFHLFYLGYIRLDDQRLGPERLQVGRGLGEGFHPESGQDDLHPFLGTVEGNPSADAAPCAGDHRDFVSIVFQVPPGFAEYQAVADLPARPRRSPRVPRVWTHPQGWSTVLY